MYYFCRVINTLKNIFIRLTSNYILLKKIYNHFEINADHFYNSWDNKHNCSTFIIYLSIFDEEICVTIIFRTLTRIDVKAFRVRRSIGCYFDSNIVESLKTASIQTNLNYYFSILFRFSKMATISPPDIK